MRLFVAIDFPHKILQPLSRLFSGLPVAKGVRTIPLEQIHLTLAFLGEVSIKDIKNSLNKIKFKSFTLKLKGVGCFPNAKYPRILWVGVEAAPDLKELKVKVEKSLISYDLFSENKPFFPHLTVARIKGSRHQLVEAFLQKYDSLESERALIQQFHLFSSRLTPSGAIHQKELTIPLINAETRAF